MGPLAVASLAPATLSAVSPLRPVQNVGQNTGAARATAVTGQDLAQDIFQRTFQAAATFPVAEPATGTAGLLQDATASLLAALNAPQPAADTTTATEAATQATAPTATNPTIGDTTTTTAPSPTPPALTLTDLPAAQDSLGTSLSADFALQTALRFGANVLGGTAPAQATSEGTGLVRDATTVLRTGNVQPHAGGPGPEAYQLRNPAAVQQAIRTYQAPPALEQPAGLDLLV
ncbi:hypothetical protein GETHLI_28090 [Geothrix limicola]|uniref:Uncharacterized protein n=1 Tax=Geothrix limicola TaxID=2927978 RepID=A0ABQ5QHY6_9BACT|nr:hypothetical protein [Geothrix limicola]GLH74307.1 hypothetical protein GETHLI_28090 [Geothrix limicola]